MIVLALLGAVVAFVLWVMWDYSSQGTLADRLWWLIPPLAFISAMFSIYCLLTLVWRGIGLHVEVSG